MPVTLIFSATDRLDSAIAEGHRFVIEPEVGVFASGALIAAYDSRNRQWDFGGRAYNVISAEPLATVTIDADAGYPVSLPKTLRYVAGTPGITNIVVEPPPRPPQRRQFSPIPREPQHFHTVYNQPPLTGQEKQRLPLTSHSTPSTEPE